MSQNRFHCVLLALAVALSMTSCADSETAKGKSEPVVPSTVEAAVAETAQSSAKAVSAAEKQAQEIVDEHAGHGHNANNVAQAVNAASEAGLNSGTYVLGEHYQLLDSPKKMAAPDKIEVMEVFWYGCSHCYRFEPLIENWLENKAEDVVFMRTPATGHPVTQMHANVYYTIEALKLPHAIHGDIFALLAKNNRIVDQKKFAEIFQKYGIDEETYLNTFNSFAVKGKVSQAGNRDQKHYRVAGTPTIIVNGKYRVSDKGAGGQAAMLAVTNHLIELERAAAQSSSDS